MQTRWGTWKVAGALIRSLDLHHNHCCVASSTAVGLIHTDAGNRISWLRRSPTLARQAGLDLGGRDGSPAGPAWPGPETLRPDDLATVPEGARLVSLSGRLPLLAGCRRAGVFQTGRCLRQTPFAVDLWLTLLIGLVGPQALAGLRRLRKPPT